MTDNTLGRELRIPEGSALTAEDYTQFLEDAYELFRRCPPYLAPSEGIDVLELAHLTPAVPETILAIYLGINDAACNKGLVSPFLPRHGHNNVFVFDPEVYAGGDDVPDGTTDATRILAGFEPPNETWSRDWTYVMIADPARSFASLWVEKGYIDMVPAKFEDFTMLSDSDATKLCTFIDPAAFEHPVNQSRPYLNAARDRGEKHAAEFTIPVKLSGEVDGLVPVMLDLGEKLYVARTDFGPCEHAWSNLHPDSRELAVVNENSAVPLDLVIAKPPVDAERAKGLIPAKGSADMTTDWYLRGMDVNRLPLLHGSVRG
ncbi:MAG: hypothetical protein QGH42_00610 [Kiritimatiellia bacterium]|jgi:hypothetical protein|nr:hypothetical protein [Kiritimatiellia bacterium]MDP6810273.1 hypothetical protein [Kiritimatiellia bacterium]MDP7022738.1 hypothetical protein [Kiritimatiellia bacterium]